MDSLRNQHGSSLVATLIVATVLLPIGGWMFMQTRADFFVARNLRAELEAVYVADAGVSHAVAQIDADGSFARLLTARSTGVSPFGNAPPPFPAAPLHYEVLVAPLDSTTLRVTSTGYGRDGANKRVEALLRRDAGGHLQVCWHEDL